MIITKLKSDQRGMAALIVVVVMLLLILSIGLAVSQFSVNAVSLSLEGHGSEQAVILAQTCADEAAFRLKKNPSFTGVSVPIGDDSCTIVVSGSGLTRTVDVEATVRNQFRSAQVSITRVFNVASTAEGIDITLWQEE